MGGHKSKGNATIYPFHYRALNLSHICSKKAELLMNIEKDHPLSVVCCVCYNHRPFVVTDKVSELEQKHSYTSTFIIHYFIDYLTGVRWDSETRTEVMIMKMMEEL